MKWVIKFVNFVFIPIWLIVLGLLNFVSLFVWFLVNILKMSTTSPFSPKTVLEIIVSSLIWWVCFYLHLDYLLNPER